MPRRRAQPPFSLFAFQDIITSVTGVMVLMTLLMAVELLQRPFREAEAAAAPQAEDLPARLEEVAAEVEAMRTKLAAKQTELADSAGMSPAQLRQALAAVQADRASLAERLAQQRNSQAVLDAAKAKAAGAAPQRAAHQAEEGRLQRKAVELAAALEDLKRSKRLVFRADSNSDKQAWLVEVDSHGARVGPIGRSAPPATFHHQDPAAVDKAFTAWVRNQDRRTTAFVLFIKPSGVEAADLLEKSLKGAGYTIGLDLLAEDMTVLDPKTGAGAP